MSELRKQMEEGIGKKWTKRLITAGIILSVYCAISFFAGIWPFSSAVGVMKKVTEPNRIVQNYEWFYDQYHAIQAQRQNIKLMPDGSADKTGTQMVLNNMIAEYNARSREITRNLWKPEELPYQISIGEE
ncbi:MAG: hypothetical protein FWH41_06665 [Treponema sp.]|nr:hypothetical protein [Treponema sp.]